MTNPQAKQQPLAGGQGGSNQKTNFDNFFGNPQNPPPQNQPQHRQPQPPPQE